MLNASDSNDANVGLRQLIRSRDGCTMAIKRTRTTCFSAPVAHFERVSYGKAAVCGASCGSLWLSCRTPYRTSACAKSQAPSLSLDVGVRSSAKESAVVAASQKPLALMSTVIGVLVLVGSVLYKVPQLLRIVRRRSARGISVVMYSLETLGMTFSAVYFARRAYPFVSFGETVFIIFTNLAILALIVRYERLPSKPAIACAVAFGFLLAFLVSPVVPLPLLMSLQVVSIPLLNLAKLPQILLNRKRKSTGELAPSTLGLQLLGNIARIFTTLAQVKDGLMLASTLVASCFNVTLFAQWLYYNTGTRATLSNNAIQ